MTADFQTAYKALANRFPQASNSWLDEASTEFFLSLRRFLALEKSAVNPQDRENLLDLLGSNQIWTQNSAFLVALLDCLLAIGEDFSVWENIVRMRFQLAHDLHFNQFILETALPKLATRLSYDSITFEDYFFFSSQVLQSSLLVCADLKQIDRELQRNLDLLNEYTVADTNQEDSCQDFDQIRMEYLSRHHLYEAMYCMKCVQTADDPQGQPLLCKAFKSLLVSLSHRPASVNGLVRQFTMNQRLSDSFTYFIVVLLTFDYRWLAEEAVPRLRTDGLKHGDSYTNYLLHQKRIHLQTELYPKKVTAVLKNIQSLHDQVDESICFDPWNLSRFLSVATWHVADNLLRDWLRKIFPDIPEYPSVNNLRISERPVLTLADLEAFILGLYFHRRLQTTTKYSTRTEAETLFFSQPIFWQPTERQSRFWITALLEHGSPSYLQRKRYLNQSMTREKFQDMIHELRGTVLLPEYLDFYALIGLSYMELLEKYKLDRSTEAAHYLQVVRQLSNVLDDTPSKPSNLWEPLDYSSLVSDDFSVEDCMERIHQIPNTRYSRYIGVTQKPVESPKKTDEKKVTEDSKVESSAQHRLERQMKLLAELKRPDAHIKENEVRHENVMKAEPPSPISKPPVAKEAPKQHGSRLQRQLEQLAQFRKNE